MELTPMLYAVISMVNSEKPMLGATFINKESALSWCKSYGEMYAHLEFAVVEYTPSKAVAE